MMATFMEFSGFHFGFLAITKYTLHSISHSFPIGIGDLASESKSSHYARGTVARTQTLRPFVAHNIEGFGCDSQRPLGGAARHPIAA
jgi:hypothetical protein